jgi:vacuolar protein sorting-associated protein 13A/C
MARWRDSIQIPWTAPLSKATKVEVQGLYMLLVPTTSVGYDAEKEERAEQEAKMARIASIEEAKNRDKLLEQGGNEQGADTFIQKLMAGVFRHLEVTVTDVQIRYEDKQTNSGDPFGAGITMDRLVIRTNKEDVKAGGKHSFKKEVVVSSLAVYWQPREKNIYSKKSYEDEDLDRQFLAGIARHEAGVDKLKYLLGPISLDAYMTWVPDPKRIDFSRPQIELTISMAKLKINVTKHQYHDFAMLLHSLNGMKLAARYMSSSSSSSS